MRTVFADTHYFFAFFNERDSAHLKATTFTLRFTGRMITSNWILMEVADGWADPECRGRFVLLLEELRSNPNATIVPFSSELFEAGLALYSARPDKAWSLTDCISFVVMERESLTDALTGDRHFEQAGFVALLK